MSVHPEKSVRDAAETSGRAREASPPVAKIVATLDALGVPLDAAEAQGLACGLLCSSPASSAKSRWFAELLDAASLDAGVLSARARELHALDAWFAAQLAALNDAELDFALALPEDEASLARRGEALGAFCAGFVYGVGIGVAARGNPTLPADTRELIEDFMAIDGAEDVDDGEGTLDEARLVELVEYVRVGVLLVHEELKPVSPGGADGTSAARRVH